MMIHGKRREGAGHGTCVTILTRYEQSAHISSRPCAYIHLTLIDLHGSATLLPSLNKYYTVTYPMSASSMRRRHGRGQTQRHAVTEAGGRRQ